MQRAPGAKTGWVHRLAPYFALGCAGLLLVVALFVKGEGNFRRAEMGGRTYMLEVADTPGLRQQGLSGRKTLDQDKGMLFVFQRESEDRCFWMNNMNFSLDIIWLDGRKRVRAIRGGLSPRTYPATFCPKVPTSYVVELLAGQVQAANIRVGQQLRF